MMTTTIISSIRVKPFELPWNLFNMSAHPLRLRFYLLLTVFPTHKWCKRRTGTLPCFFSIITACLS
jgi:hypothetical protein